MKLNWKIIKQDTYPGHKEKKFGKKHKQLVVNILENLEKYFELLKSGEHPEHLKRFLSFVHDEKQPIFVLDIAALDISSTKIRKRVKEGRSIASLVTESVEDFIKRKGLYL